MRILHCCLANFYIDNYSYQENVLPREHKRAGHDVAILASTEVFLDNSTLGYTSPGSYVNEDGIPVTRLPYRRYIPHRLVRKLRLYEGVTEALAAFRPDVLFLHDCQFLDIVHFADYAARNPEVQIIVDCHADFSNSARTWLSRNILHRIIYRHCARVVEPHTLQFYGVLPARVDFLVEMYGLPRSKVDLLLMGAEDEKVAEATDEAVRSEIRERCGASESDFLLMTGGKIDLAKRQTLLLMQAVNRLNDESVKLVVFGSVAEELRDEFFRLCDNERIRYLGWIDAGESYKYFAAANLVVFPGRHSVFWEQVVGLGVPIVVKEWEGTTHVDIGGNCLFLREDSVDEMVEVIQRVVRDPDLFQQMKRVAQTEGMKRFSYSRIAEESISACGRIRPAPGA